MGRDNPSGERETVNQLDLFRENFDGYLIAGAIVLVEYSALTVFMPSLATPLAIVTLLGIAIFYFRK
jgi:uncharacterized membrane protein YobD (UPF0266 family)